MHMLKYGTIFKIVAKSTFLLVHNPLRISLKVQIKTECLLAADGKFFVFASGLIVPEKWAGTGNTI
jgi:hypothetical protein